MWIKLYNVLDSVLTDAQRETAYRYAELWLNTMVEIGITREGMEQYALAIITLAERVLS